MKKRAHGLLSEIEQDVLDESKSLAGVLRKCIILGGKAGSAELREWATRELKGYKGSDTVPDFRVVAAPILVNWVSPTHYKKGERISPDQLPDVVAERFGESVELRQGVGELEAALHQHESGDGMVRLSLPSGADVARMMNYERDDEFQAVTDVYWSVSCAAIRGVVDNVRTALSELVAELRAGTPDDQEMPSAGVADQAVGVVVGGKRNRVVFNNAQASEGSTSTIETSSGKDGKPGFWTVPRKIGAFLVGLATILTLVVTVFMWKGL